MSNHGSSSGNILILSNNAKNKKINNCFSKAKQSATKLASLFWGQFKANRLHISQAKTVFGRLEWEYTHFQSNRFFFFVSSWTWRMCIGIPKSRQWYLSKHAVMHYTYPLELSLGYKRKVEAIS